MNYTKGENSIKLELLGKERFYFKFAYLMEIDFEFTPFFQPHFPRGSIIARLLHGFYRLKYIDGPVPLHIKGIYPRGNFYWINIDAGKEYYVSPEYVAGFSGNIKNLHTKIKILPFKTFPIFYTLRSWFFSIYTGPGHVLVYTDSSFDNTKDKKLQPERIVAFDITRRFKPTPPGSVGTESQIFQFFNKNVNMEFIDEGDTLCVQHTFSRESGKTGNRFRELVKHILGFFRFA